MIWKYVEIQKLSEAKNDETICASYPTPCKNVAGKKKEEKMKKAYRDAKQGKCRLLVWRCVDEPGPFGKL